MNIKSRWAVDHCVFVCDMDQAVQADECGPGLAKCELSIRTACGAAHAEMIQQSRNGIFGAKALVHIT